MVLRWQRRGRVGRCRGKFTKGALLGPLRVSADERREEGEREADDGDGDRGRGEQPVQCRFGAPLGQGQAEPGGVASDEASGVGEVVHARQEKPRDEEDKRPLTVLLQDEPTEGATARSLGAKTSK